LNSDTGKLKDKARIRLVILIAKKLTKIYDIYTVDCFCTVLWGSEFYFW